MWKWFKFKSIWLLIFISSPDFPYPGNGVLLQGYIRSNRQSAFRNFLNAPHVKMRVVFFCLFFVFLFFLHSICQALCWALGHVSFKPFNKPMDWAFYYSHFANEERFIWFLSDTKFWILSTPRTVHFHKWLSVDLGSVIFH